MWNLTDLGLRERMYRRPEICSDGVCDGTLGGAGHALEVCRRLGPDGRFIGIDQDEAAVKNGYEKLEEFENVTIVRDIFNFPGIMDPGSEGSTRGAA